MRTVDRVKKKFIEEGFESCLSKRRTIQIYERKVDGDTEVHLITIACSKPSKGYAKWFYRILAGQNS